jgi:hypothetical protein
MSTDRPPLRPLAGSSGEIPEDRYRHDLALHDRFLGFGTELLRISSLGLAAFGFVLVTKSDEQTIATEVIIASVILKCIVALAPVCFGVSIAFALYHRFLASDGMFHHFRAIKLIDLKDPNHAQRIQHEEETRNSKFKKSEACLYASGIALGVGAGLFAIAFVWIVLSANGRETKANKTSLSTPAPPRVQSAMTIQPSTSSRSLALGQV